MGIVSELEAYNTAQKQNHTHNDAYIEVASKPKNNNKSSKNVESNDETTYANII